MRKKPKRKGYYQGGQISTHSLGDAIMGGANMALGAYKAYQTGKYLGAAADKMKADSERVVDDGNFDPAPDAGPGAAPGNARGGKIRKTAGPRIGKDDGLIPAQKGEYVIRRSAVKKLGTKVLNQVNKGKLPKAGARGR